MKVSKELIEKYHSDNCSAEERDAVEAWLFSEESEEELELPFYENKADHKMEMWAEIQNILPEEKAKKNTFIPLKSWYKAIAACMILGLFGRGLYQFFSKDSVPVENHVSINNTSSLEIKRIDSQGYDISIGPNSLASINYHTGIIDFSGSILISPKKDIELMLEGSSQKYSFKVGQTYIAMNDKSGREKMIIVNERSLNDLPPALQKQLISQFNI